MNLEHDLNKIQYCILFLKLQNFDISKARNRSSICQTKIKTVSIPSSYSSRKRVKKNKVTLKNLPCEDKGDPPKKRRLLNPSKSLFYQKPSINTDLSILSHDSNSLGINTK